MAKRFKRRKDGRVVAHLDEHEIALLARLFADVSTLLEPDGDAVSTPEWAVGLGLDGLGDDRAVEAPDDPALARLLPDAHRDDPGASAEFRRLTERALRERKRTALETSVTLLVDWAGGGAQTMDLDQARALAASLTDVRLVLADRLGVRTEADAEALHEREPDDDDPGDPSAWLAMVYEFTTWVQESLSGVLLDALPREGDGRRAAPDAGGPPGV
jgi:hypothetical protein